MDTEQLANEKNVYLLQNMLGETLKERDYLVTLLEPYATVTFSSKGKMKVVMK